MFLRISKQSLTKRCQSSTTSRLLKTPPLRQFTCNLSTPRPTPHHNPHLSFSKPHDLKQSQSTTPTPTPTSTTPAPTPTPALRPTPRPTPRPTYKSALTKTQSTTAPTTTTPNANSLFSLSHPSPILQNDTHIKPQSLLNRFLFGIRNAKTVSGMQPAFTLPFLCSFTATTTLASYLTLDALQVLHNQLGEVYGRQWIPTLDANSIRILAATADGSEVEDNITVGANNHILIEILSQQNPSNDPNSSGTAKSEETGSTSGDGKGNILKDGDQFAIPEDPLSALIFTLRKWSKLVLLRPQMMVSHAIRICQLALIFLPPVAGGIFLIAMDYLTYWYQSIRHRPVQLQQTTPLTFSTASTTSTHTTTALTTTTTTTSTAVTQTDDSTQFIYARPELIAKLYSAWWQWFKVTLQFSGSAWVKLGQYLSQRPDVLSPDICQVLSELQSDNSSHSYSETCAILTEELPDWQEYLFIAPEDREKPLGSGSIAQVYRATFDIDRYTEIYHQQLPYSANNNCGENWNGNANGNHNQQHEIEPFWSSEHLPTQNSCQTFKNLNFSRPPQEFSKLINQMEAYLPRNACDPDPADHTVPDPDHPNHSLLTSRHRTRLQGKIPVAIKITHPSATPSITRDLQLMFFMMEMLEVFPIHQIQCTCPTNLAMEFARMMLSQLDLRQEGRNLARFQHNFNSVDFLSMTPVFPTPILSRKSTLVESFHSGLGMFELIEQYHVDQERYGPVVSMLKGIEHTDTDATKTTAYNTTITRQNHQLGFSPLAIHKDYEAIGLKRVQRLNRIEELYQVLNAYEQEEQQHHHHHQQQHYQQQPPPFYPSRSFLSSHPNYLPKFTELRQYQQEDLMTAMSPAQYSHITGSVASSGLEAFLLMLLASGFFHADLHAGNLMLDLGYRVMNRDRLNETILQMKEMQQTTRDRSTPFERLRLGDLNLGQFAKAMISDTGKSIAQIVLPNAILCSFATLLPPHPGPLQAFTSSTSPSLHDDVSYTHFNNRAYNPRAIYPNLAFNMTNSIDVNLHPAYNSNPASHYKSILYEIGIPQPEFKPSLCILDCGLATGLSFTDRTNFSDLFYNIALGRGREVAAMMIHRAPEIFVPTRSQHAKFYQQIRTEQNEHLQLQKQEKVYEEIIRQRIYAKASIFGKVGLAFEETYQKAKNQWKVFCLDFMATMVHAHFGAPSSNTTSADDPNSPGNLFLIGKEKPEVLESFDFGVGHSVELTNIPYNPVQTRQDRRDYIQHIGGVIDGAFAYNRFSLSSTQAVHLLLTLLTAAQRHSIALDTSFVGVVIATLCIEGVSRSLNTTIDVIGPGVAIISAATFKHTERILKQELNQQFEKVIQRIGETAAEGENIIDQARTRSLIATHNQQTRWSKMLKYTGIDRIVAYFAPTTAPTTTVTTFSDTNTTSNLNTINSGNDNNSNNNNLSVRNTLLIDPSLKTPQNVIDMVHNTIGQTADMVNFTGSMTASTSLIDGHI